MRSINKKLSRREWRCSHKSNNFSLESICILKNKMRIQFFRQRKIKIEFSGLPNLFICSLIYLAIILFCWLCLAYQIYTESSLLIHSWAFIHFAHAPQHTAAKHCHIYARFSFFSQKIQPRENRFGGMVWGTNVLAYDNKRNLANATRFVPGTVV